MNIKLNDNAYILLFFAVIFSYAAYEKFSDNSKAEKASAQCTELKKAALAASAPEPKCSL